MYSNCVKIQSFNIFFCATVNTIIPMKDLKLAYLSNYQDYTIHSFKFYFLNVFIFSILHIPQQTVLVDYIPATTTNVKF